MRIKQFEVPAELISEFAEVLADNSLNNAINGVNEDGEIIIAVSYDKDERAAVFSLSEILDDYYEEYSEEDDSDEDDD